MHDNILDFTSEMNCKWEINSAVFMGLRTYQRQNVTSENNNMCSDNLLK